jgi:hypothetical protein
MRKNILPACLIKPYPTVTGIISEKSKISVIISDSITRKIFDFSSEVCGCLLENIVTHIPIARQRPSKLIPVIQALNSIHQVLGNGPIDVRSGQY